ncbi:potential ZIP metal ion transporter [Pseudozyma hubeiensis SY62]|uniref:Potential ZIP metal ion transporter n=1 Tax=Pseudozyma hubeiensis (strain SY62) TaxID=1305764 RepID=R9PDZ7_PSEHS|nr:potential ZIP metal ion transporter [Pseudozyma hubeiensis SY62]GAC99581.1 potential ZIP metal ion transporter [Pseudozyma hubeiensis SY62]
MSGLFAFVLLVSGMGVGTLVCGLIPLSLPLSHRMMRILEVFGAGLLVGAAVTVVIPEGSSSLFSNVTPQAPSAPNLYTDMLHSAAAFTPTAQPQAGSISGAQASQEPWAWSFITKRSDEPSPGHDRGNHGHEHGHEHDDHDGSTFTQSDAEHRLGSSILFGIVLMYIIDQLTSSSADPSHDHNSDKVRDHHHGGDYASTPARPRLEAHRLSKSFHHRTDPSAPPNTIHKVTSRASFTVFDRSQHGIDEEAQTASAAVGGNSSSTDAPHRRVESVATASSSSDQDLPDDYDDHDADSYRHSDLKRSAHSNREWHSSPRSSTTLHRDGLDHEVSVGAPLLHRQTSALSNARPASKRSRSMSSSHAANSTFGQALTTIVGLLIHAAADGIAMGASAQSGDETLTMVVFIAIMVHKAPAAFGLCAMLMSQRLSRTSIRKAVAIFALASPVGALVTYGLLALFFDSGLSAVHGATADAQGGIDGKSIGTALAFSGGTFLFVAFHAVLELAGAEADTVPTHSASADAPGETQILGKWLRIVLLIAGACTPRMLQGLLASLGAGEGHHH